jgi:DNA-binding GntR family transcriptional regulator
LREIYDMRIALETLAVRRVAGRLTAAQVQSAGDLIAAMDSSEEIAVFVEHNRKFHELLVEGCESPRLIATLRTLRDAAAVYVGTSLGNTQGLMRSSNREHAELLDACVTGDESRAVAILVRHFRTTVDTVLTEH